MNKIKALLVNTEDKKFELVEIEPTLKEYYRLLHCDTIDIVERKFSDGYHDIICDDEGLFKEDPKPSAFDKNGNPMLVGSILVVNTRDGEEVTLSTAEILSITENHLGRYVQEGSLEIRPALIGLDY